MKKLDAFLLPRFCVDSAYQLDPMTYLDIAYLALAQFKQSKVQEQGP